MGRPETVSELFTLLIGIIESAVMMIFAVAVLIIFWGVYKYVTQAGTEESKKEGRFAMVGGIVILVVMLSVWVIINLLQDGFFGGDIHRNPFYGNPFTVQETP